jgi:hypothetical protein
MVSGICLRIDLSFQLTVLPKESGGAMRVDSQEIKKASMPGSLST